MADLLPSDVKGLDPTAEREDDNQEILDTKVKINGTPVKIGDIFPDIFDARNFARQVALIDAGNKPEKAKPDDPASVMDSADEEQGDDPGDILEND